MIEVALIFAEAKLFWVIFTTLYINYVTRSRSHMSLITHILLKIGHSALLVQCRQLLLVENSFKTSQLSAEGARQDVNLPIDCSN